VDVLSVAGCAWASASAGNPVEFEALGENIKNRGKRVEEQIEVMRLLWTKELVTYEGQWHRRARRRNQAVAPSSGRFPCGWVGESEAVLRRAARLADGWISCRLPSGPAASKRWTVSTTSSARRAAIPPTFGYRGRVALAQLRPEERAKEMAAWRAMRASRTCASTRWASVFRPRGPCENARTLKKERSG